MILTALGIVATALWIATSLRAAVGVRRLPLLAEVDPPTPVRWPRLSVVVAACNEERTLEPALRTLLAQDYPELEVVAVDDRSTDGTGAIVDRVAAENRRLLPVHVQALPAGWLGKVHALHQGTARASGDWLLFTDADVHFAPGALRRAVAYAEQHGHDHLTAFPDLPVKGKLHGSVFAAFGNAFFLTLRPEEVERPDSKAYTGIGAFNLVRRAAFERTEGFEWLRLEIADDVGLGLLLRRAGARSCVLLGTRALWVDWYPSLGAMFQGMEKNLFAVAAGYSVTRAIFGCGLPVLLVLAPLAAAVGPGPLGSWAWALPAVSYASVVLGGLAMRARLPLPRASIFLTPVGFLLLAGMLARSTWATLRRRGVVWRGTRYGLAELRAGRRVKL